MARKSQRLRRQRRIERMKAREQQNSTPVEGNSVMIQKVKDEIEGLAEDNLESLADMIDTQFGHLLNKPKPQVIEELIEVEKQIINLFENSVIEPEINLKSLLKRELLAIAKEKNLQDISSKNTKTQIIAAIQSTN